MYETTVESSGSSSPTVWRPGSRLARLRASHSYRFVGILVVVTFVFTAAAPNESWAKSVLVLLQCATLIAALWTSGLGRDRLAILALVVIGPVIAIVQLLVGGTTLIGIVGILNMLLVAATIVVIALGVIDQRQVNRQSVTGAVCIYVLIGILFTFVYGAAAVRRVSGRSSRRAPTARRRSSSTSATSRWRRSATATTRRLGTSVTRWPCRRRCSGSSIS